MDRPDIERRRFLGALAAATAAVGCQAAKASAPEPKKPSASNDAWDDVRAEFELSSDWVHLAGFLLASHPKRVRDAIERHRHELDMNPALYLEGRVVDHKAPPPTTADMMTPGGFHSFEHRWAVGEAFEFHLALGKDKVERRIVETVQGRACQDETRHPAHAARPRSVRGYRHLRSRWPRAQGRRRASARKRIVASTTPYAVSYARLAPAIFNSPADVDRALSEIQSLA